MRHKNGIVDVGGGYRGVYATGQRMRNYQFYTEYGLRKEYAGIKNFLFKKPFVDLDYVYGTLSNSDGEYPLYSLSHIVALVLTAHKGKNKGNKIP